MEPEETAVTIPYKHICDMTPENRNRAVERFMVTKRLGN
jgi:hypothetical protein